MRSNYDLLVGYKSAERQGAVLQKLLSADRADAELVCAARYEVIIWAIPSSETMEASDAPPLRGSCIAPKILSDRLTSDRYDALSKHNRLRARHKVIAASH
jgi:hypothetical protein